MNDNAMTAVAKIARALNHGGAEHLRDNFRDCRSVAEALCASARQHFNDQAGSDFIDSALLDYELGDGIISSVTCTGRTIWFVHRDGTVVVERRREGGRWVLGPSSFSGPDDPAQLAGGARMIAIAVLGDSGFRAAFPRTAKDEDRVRAEYEARAAADNASW